MSITYLDAIREAQARALAEDGEDFGVRLVLGRLLDAGVDVADDRLHLPDELALHRAQQAQHAVRGRVVRPEVDREQLVLGLQLGAEGGLADLSGVDEVTHTSAASCAR